MQDFPPSNKPAPGANASARDADVPPPPDTRNRAPHATGEYHTDRITVQWFAKRCIHSVECMRALPQVFDPTRRPWVDVAAAEADQIAKAVALCPTRQLAPGKRIS